MLQGLLGDMSPSVLSAAVFAFTELCPDQLDLLHTHYHRMVRTTAPESRHLLSPAEAEPAAPCSAVPP